MEEKLPKGALGGQAVIEGVMMRGKNRYSIAVRRPDKKIEVKLHKNQSLGEKYVVARIPFIRGVVNFVESMVVGMKTLSYSSSFYEEEEEETKADKLIKEIFKEKAESVIIGLTLMLSVIIAVALFMLLPAAIGEFVGKWVDSRVLLSVIEGAIRLFIFIIYVILISQMEDIKRVFMYHGAEHKTINCYESGDALTPENVAKHSRYHKRCGTSFLFIVMVVSIFIFMFITADQMWLRFLLRLLLIPVVAGISYEFIKLAGKNDNVIMNILSKPGMWIQKLTTKEPDEEMIQVAILSVESVLYGKPYVDAVNEAQGIGKKSTVVSADAEKKSTKQTEELSDIDDIDKVDYEELEEENDGVIEEVSNAYVKKEESIDDEMEEFIDDEVEEETEEVIDDEIEEAAEEVNDEVEEDAEEEISDEVEKDTEKVISDEVKEDVEKTINDEVQEEIEEAIEMLEDSNETILKNETSSATKKSKKKETLNKENNKKADVEEDVIEILTDED